MDAFILGIDVGTTSLKVSVVNREGKLLAQESVPTKAYQPVASKSTAAEQDVALILDALSEALGRLSSHLLKGILAIGVTGQMHGVVLWSKENPEHFSQLITWEDERWWVQISDRI